MPKVLLVSMPFGALERPALGISLLKAGLLKDGQDCEIRYLTNLFAHYIGTETYNWICNSLPHTAFAGEWLFRNQLLPAAPEEEKEYIDTILKKTWMLDDTVVTRLLQARAAIPHFLSYCLETIDWEEYAIVGFTSTFEQNIASLAMAKMVKEKYPGIQTVFGGANFEGEMGLELHRKFSFIDYICSGEADNSFPALVRCILQNKEGTSPASVKGIVFRDNGQSVYTGQAALVRELDNLPVPDFSDYFDTLYQDTFMSLLSPVLLMETSRGCWWGEKSHCTFCGLNGGSMAFRSKNAQRALDELLYLVDRWEISFVEIVDNILDMRYFKDFLPALSKLPRPVSLYYETKANLSKKQVEILFSAGAHRIQPGIESLSNHVLSLMQKGTTGLRNIQLLKWCKELNIGVDWNVLYGFPGETQQDYDDMLALFPAIRFLQPPSACGPIRLDRFSPYFMRPDHYGFTHVKPIAPYRFLYPFEPESLQKIAYYFDYEYASGVQSATYAQKVIAYIRDWQQQPETGELKAFYYANRLTLLDTRAIARRAFFELTKYEQAIYEYCDELRTIASIRQHLLSQPGILPEDNWLPGFLQFLLDNFLMVTDGTHFLSLAIRYRDPVAATSYSPSLEAISNMVN